MITCRRQRRRPLTTLNSKIFIRFHILVVRLRPWLIRAIRPHHCPLTLSLFKHFIMFVRLQPLDSYNHYRPLGTLLFEIYHGCNLQPSDSYHGRTLTTFMRFS